MFYLLLISYPSFISLLNKQSTGDFTSQQPLKAMSGRQIFADINMLPSFIPHLIDRVLHFSYSHPCLKKNKQLYVMDKNQLQRNILQIFYA